MQRITHLTLLLLLVVYAPTAHAQSPQTNYMDTLRHIAGLSIPDTLKAEQLGIIGAQQLRSQEAEIVLSYISELEEIAERTPCHRTRFYMHMLKGVYYSGLEMYPDAIKHELLAISAAASIPDLDPRHLMSVYNTIGIAYSNRGQNKKAASYFEKALRIAEKRKIRNAIAIYSNNLGLEYHELKQHIKARAFMKRAARFFLQEGMETYLPTVQVNIGITFQMMNEYDSALSYYRKAYKGALHDNDPHMTALCLCNMSEVYLLTGRIDSSLVLNKLAFKNCDTVNDRYQMRNILMLFSNIYTKRGEFKQAHHFLSEYMRVNAELFNQEENQKTNDAELAQQGLIKQNEIALLKKNHEIDHIQLERNRIMFWAVLIISVAGATMLLITWRRFREKKKANLVLSAQKSAIEFQQKEITDSIAYAQRIQHALLPPAGQLEQYFSDAFILYKPKHIVSGDFYYVDKTGDAVWVAVVDCTGHGVPGGFMSVMAHNLLKQCLQDEKIQAPEKVLERMSQLVVENLSRHQTLRDGMDMAICRFMRQGENTEIVFAGANNPLWVLRKNAGSLEEFPATRQHIGYTEKPIAFTSHNFTCGRGDQIYLFTDGYADQFGGEKGKKYKYKRLKEFILLHASMPAEAQQQALEKEFLQWQQHNEQMDDVTIMGVQI